MSYISTLKAGIEPKIVAKDLAQQIVLAPLDNGEISLDLASSFVNDTLRFIGIEGLITPQQVFDANNGTVNFQWPMEQLQIYSFHCNKFEFERVENFLVALCHEMHEQNKVFVENLNSEDEDIENICSPVELLMHLIAVWCTVYKHLLKENTWGTARMFEEPLARINICLLQGLHCLRKEYRAVFPVLDAICSRLYISAQQGLSYKQSCDKIFTCLLDLISQDIELFKNETMDFFYQVFSIQYFSSKSKLLQSLKEMLEEYDETRLTILTDILINRKLQNVYFTMLVTTQNKEIVKQQMEILEFLYMLQSKLLAIDCFSRDFVEAILNLVLSSKTNISTLACKVYLAISKRILDDKNILMHILEFYFDHVPSRNLLGNYIYPFFKQFSYMSNVYNLMEIISNNQLTEEFRCLVSHVAVTVVGIFVELNESPLNEIEPVLQFLPEMLENMPSQQCIGILLSIFKYVSMETLQRQTLDHIVSYGINIFQDVENEFQYPLLMNIFSILNKSINITKDWEQMESLCGTLAAQFSRLARVLEIYSDDKTKKLADKFYVNFIGLLKRLNIVIKTRYELFDLPMDIFNVLQQYVLVEDEHLYTADDFAFMDAYAVEICVSVIIKVAKRETQSSLLTSSYFKNIQKLCKFLYNFLKNIEKVITYPAFRLKAYFSSLLNFYCHMPVQLPANVYSCITQILLALQTMTNSDFNMYICEDEIQQSHPLQTLEYYRIMFLHYIELHKYSHIHINTNIVWKICIHFGKPRNRFNEELQQLLITLSSFRIEIYTHINGVMIYNLYKQQPPLKPSIIIAVLKKHKHLIDNNVNIKSPEVFKINTVLLVLQIVGKGLRVQKVSNQHNRLLALRNLSIFLEDLDLNALQAKDLILEQITEYEKHLLTSEELQILESFQAEIGVSS
ncbi:sisters unbound [Haematobia irritans]|uniref:sisters unbound n=1 Tax=Haematobia irritans TaxID=7368 RepID=UPI003F500792